MNLTFGSLFSGVGGFDLGFLRNDWECKWMVEFDKNAAGVLAHHYPDVPLHCDVTKVDVDELEVPDVVLAGFPCQDVSQAGLRKGLHEGTRSNLFFQSVRVIQRLRDKGSLRFALFENVPGLFSVDDGDGFARCIRKLLDVGSTSVGWTVLDAQHVGWCTSEGRRIRSVPQRRRRVFICASFGDTGEAAAREIFSFSSRLSRDTSTRGEEGEGTPSSFTEGVGGGGGEGTIGVDVYNGQVTGEVAASVTSASGISNATGPKVMESKAFGFKHGQSSDAGTLGIEDELCPTLLGGEGGAQKPAVCHEGDAKAFGISNATGPKVMGFATKQQAMTVDEVANTLAGNDYKEPQAVCSWNGDITPKSAEDVSVTLRSQQGGEGTGVAFEGPCYENHAQDSRVKDCGETSPTIHGKSGTGGNNLPLIRSQQGGEGTGVAFEVCPDHCGGDKSGQGVAQQGEPLALDLYNFTINDKTSQTLRGNAAQCKEHYGGEMQGNMVVRRLTPMECCRLQAWEDTHLDVREELVLMGNRWFPTGKQVEQADSAKYKQAGNGVAANCSEWIARRMRHVMER